VTRHDTRDVEELWRPVVGFDGYEVSNHGRVRSRLRRSAARLLKPKFDKNGYREVSLGDGQGGHKYRRVHRLVLEAFVGPCPPGMLCRHFPDRDPNNNRLDNLSWGTPLENRADMVVHGTQQAGHWHHRATAKLSEYQVWQIRNLLSEGALSQRNIAARFGVRQQAISKINRGLRWSHLLKETA